MKDLIIPYPILESIEFSADELKIEIAAYLYQKEKLSIGKAKKLAGLTQIEFQKELAKRNICINYDIDDLKIDLKNLESL